MDLPRCHKRKIEGAHKLDLIKFKSLGPQEEIYAMNYFYFFHLLIL